MPTLCFFIQSLILKSMPMLWEAVRGYRYHKRVYLFPFWEEIYVNDGERRQDMDKARNTCRMMKQVYTELGYEVVEVPFLPPKQRAEWILEDMMKRLS
ncbi:MAG: AAA family ATPase [Hungatella sp.]|nr:AAA family ATPase [Hungatella sp.]